ncbi:MAG TPA: dephospho-CoA kinase [Terriglobales bacterium]|nr:dephospho-CoA kinase [Terriglobales bacterium]
MLKVGLTGGISSGKSVIGEMFASFGAYVIQSDIVAHQLLQPGEAVYDTVVAQFGTGILNPDRSVNRARLAELAFGQPSRIQELNKIVHPAVIEHENRWMDDLTKKDPRAIAIVEAALILEAGSHKRFDRLIVVTCRPEQRIERWASKMKVDLVSARREVTRRMAAQLPDEEKSKAADYVIDNSGSLDLTRQKVDQVYEKLRQAERSTHPNSRFAPVDPNA